MPDVFQILADPTRRRLVEALQTGEHSVSELVEEEDIGQPGVSRQLAILQEARCVAVRPAGRRRLYALRPEPFQALHGWMTGSRATWEAPLGTAGVGLGRRRRPATTD